MQNSQQIVCLIITGKAQVQPIITLMIHAQYQSSGNGTSECNSAIINDINYSCAFPALTCQTVCCQKGC